MWDLQAALVFIIALAVSLPFSFWLGRRIKRRSDEKKSQEQYKAHADESRQVRRARQRKAKKRR